MLAVDVILQPSPVPVGLGPCHGFMLRVHGAESACASYLVDRRYRRGAWYAASGIRVEATGSTWLVWISDESHPAIEAPQNAIPLLRVTPSGHRPSLWIPLASELNPVVTAKQVTEFLPTGYSALVWAPATGFVGFETEDQIAPIRTVKLLSDMRRRIAWQSPPDVPQLPRALLGISLETPPSVGSMMEQMRQDFGGPPQKLMELKPSRDEQQKSGLGERARKALFRFLDRMIPDQKEKAEPKKETTEKVTGKPKLPAEQASTGASAFQEFMRGFLAPLSAFASSISESMQRDREREIEKLMKLFQENPDEALKYAIPINGLADAFRGFSMPGSKLLSRLTDFSLAGAGGVGPADFWNISSKHRAELMLRYRQQANREAAAGRYRRAAYIYANLLADFTLAATVLERGRFYQEAAALYLDKLKRPMDASRCYALSGQYEEAVALLIPLKQFEKAAEIWESAGEPERAIELYKQAVNHLLDRGDILDAAQMMKDKLKQRDQAIDLLMSQWPSGSEVKRSFLRGATWLAEAGRHEETLEHVTKLFVTHTRVKHDQVLILASILQQISVTYPDTRVREYAEDKCRLSVAYGLRNNFSDSWKQSLLTTLSQLHPSDLQLRRDSADYLKRPGVKNKAITNLPAPKVQEADDKSALKLLSRTSLFKHGRVIDARMQGNVFVCLHADGTKLRAHFCSHTGEMLQATPPVLIDSLPNYDRRQVFLTGFEIPDPGNLVATAYAPLKKPSEVVADGKGKSVAKLMMKNLDMLAVQEPVAGEPWYLYNHDDGATLRSGTVSYALDLEIMRSLETHEITEETLDNPVWRLELFDGRPVVSIMHALFTIENHLPTLLHTTTGPICDMATSMPKTLARVVLAHRSGLDLVYLSSGDHRVLDQEQAFYKCEFFSGGKVLAWTENEIHVFTLAGEQIRRVCRFNTNGAPLPVAVLKITPGVAGFVYEDGTFETYRLA